MAEISAEEVYRNVEKLDKRIEQGFRDIRIDLNNNTVRFVSMDKYNALVDRVEIIEDSSKWKFRTIAELIIGSILFVLIGALAIKAGLQ